MIPFWPRLEIGDVKNVSVPGTDDDVHEGVLHVHVHVDVLQSQMGHLRVRPLIPDDVRMSLQHPEASEWSEQGPFWEVEKVRIQEVDLGFDEEDQGKDRVKLALGKRGNRGNNDDQDDEADADGDQQQQPAVPAAEHQQQQTQSVGRGSRRKRRETSPNLT